MGDHLSKSKLYSSFLIVLFSLTIISIIVLSSVALSINLIKFVHSSSCNSIFFKSFFHIFLYTSYIYFIRYLCIPFFVHCIPFIVYLIYLLLDKNSKQQHTITWMLQYLAEQINTLHLNSASLKMSGLCWFEWEMSPTVLDNWWHFRGNIGSMSLDVGFEVSKLHTIPSVFFPSWLWGRIWALGVLSQLQCLPPP